MPDELAVLLLAFVQGLTEFLPISSSAHLVLLPQWLGWEDQGLAIDVATHVGTLGAVLIYFRKRLLELGVATVHTIRTGTQSENSRYAGYLVVATIPVVIVGWLSKDFVESYTRSVFIIGVTTVVFGLLLLLADQTGRRTKQDTDLTVWFALLIGVAQVLALIPGTSRSGITITCALLLGFTRSEAARFSFLLAIPTILAAAGLTVLDLMNTEATIDWISMMITSTTSFVIAYLCIEFFLRIVERIGMVPFVIYRVLLGSGLLASLWLF